MAKVPIKHHISRQEFIAISSIALITLGGMLASLLGITIIGWVCLVLGIIILGVSEKIKIWHSPILIPVILIAISSVVTYFISTSTTVTSIQLSRLWAGIIVCLAYTSWATQKHRQILLILGFVGIGTALSFLLPFIVDWTVAKSSLIPDSISQMFSNLTLTTNTVHPNIIASLIILLLPIPFAYLLIALPRWNRHPNGLILLALGVAGLMGLALLMSKSRGGLLGAGLSFIFLLWFCHYQKIAKIITLVVGALIAVLIFFSIQSVDQSSSHLLNYGSISFRTRVWGIAIMMLQDFPFTGVGMGTFNETAARLYPAFSGMVTNPSAHNIFLQIGVDLGLMGVIAMTAVYLLTLFMGKQSIQYFAQQQDTILWAMSAGLTTGIIATLLHGIADITVWGTRGTFAPWMVMGLLSAIYVSIRLPQT